MTTKRKMPEWVDKLTEAEKEECRARAREVAAAWRAEVLDAQVILQVLRDGSVRFVKSSDLSPLPGVYKSVGGAKRSARARGYEVVKVDLAGLDL